MNMEELVDDDGYRSREKKLVLPSRGIVPETACMLDQDEQDAAISWLARVDQALRSIQSRGRDALIRRTTPTGAEKFLAWKRWVLSHHLFIPTLALVGHCLDEAVCAFEGDDRHTAGEWVALASRLRKGCGSLFLYSVDFQPCAPIYCGCIRNQMPVAFSGYEIRERQFCYLPAAARFHACLGRAAVDSFVVDLRQNWAAADRRYHELHERCMLLAVTGIDSRDESGRTGEGVKPESLRAQYRRQHGEAPELGEEAFAAYDRWFAIERTDGVTRADYIYQVCDVIERLIGDLLIGHRLEVSVVADLIDSIRATLVVFGRWVGPVSVLSAFFPRTARGE